MTTEQHQLRFIRTFLENYDPPPCDRVTEGMLAMAIQDLFSAIDGKLANASPTPPGHRAPVDS